ncbi:MAG: hypothetical protein Q7T18_07940 [Sedimentisphaerales bacterium]|nr:hypothetical protein [Sedimentisphaerales bacterium]
MSKAVLLTMVLLTASLAGCASSKVSCLHDHKIVTAKADSALVHIPYVDIQHEGDTLIVSGALKRREVSSQSMATHIDITIFDEKGTLITQARTDEMYVPRKQIGKGPNFARFKVAVPMDVGQDITVRVAPHGDNSCSPQKS